ncbi:hypothetical protein B5807_00185 [Epicoccum nigrum]|uniref:CBM-cenC domain-containing protein n=1 Tax=Epicoccum nigrum TaxID=105696 RepID=A0A1Y2MBX8_EPING|nr:hypothetical protein B5807_00185 [Epicoccum nigrum]
MKFSCTLALLGATTVIAAPSTLRRQSGTTNVVENGSFEDGATGWTLDGGAQVLSNDESNHWNFKAPEGTHFGLLTWSNQNATTSTLSTPVGGLTVTGHTLSYDWSYLVSSTGRGPPNVQCTLKTTLYSGFTVQSWTRRASAGGKGHVSETFDANTSGGTVAINFECTGDAGTAVVNAGVAIDNVEYTGTVA